MWNSGLQQWDLTSGGGGGTQDDRYDRSSSGSGGFSGTFDTVGSFGGTYQESASSRSVWHQDHTYGVANGAWTVTLDGFSFDKTSSSTSASGSGSYSTSTPDGSSQGTLDFSVGSSDTSRKDVTWHDGPDGHTRTTTDSGSGSSWGDLNYSASGSSSGSSTYTDPGNTVTTDSQWTSNFSRSLNVARQLVLRPL